MPTAGDRAKAVTVGEMATRANYEVLRAGRETVQRSATRWRRVTDGNPCGFCAMVASRGPVYHSQASAEGYHAHCGCTAEPYDGDPADWVPSADEQRFLEAYRESYQTGMDTRVLADKIEALLKGGGSSERFVQQEGVTWARGIHKAIIQAEDLTDEQRDAFLRDVEAVLDRAGDVVQDRPVTFFLGDTPNFRRSPQTGGFVIQGVDVVHVNPRVVKGGFGKPGNLMPAGSDVSLPRYVLTHELGHVIDNAAGHTHRNVKAAGLVFRRNKKNLSTYGASSRHEGYAEAWAQWQLGGPGSHPVADAYAEAYGWK